MIEIPSGKVSLISFEVSKIVKSSPSPYILAVEVRQHSIKNSRSLTVIFMMSLKSNKSNKTDSIRTYIKFCLQPLNHWREWDLQIVLKSLPVHYDPCQKFKMSSHWKRKFVRIQKDWWSKCHTQTWILHEILIFWKDSLDLKFLLLARGQVFVGSGRTLTC